MSGSGIVCHCTQSTAKDGHLHEEDGTILCLHYEGEDGTKCPQCLTALYPQKPETPMPVRPLTFQDVFEPIYKEAFDLLVERQKKYGPENIRRLGLFGVFGRLSDDKVERVRHGMNGRIERGVAWIDKMEDFNDESFEDALLDIANYALIMICLKRGLWGRPLA